MFYNKRFICHDRTFLNPSGHCFIVSFLASSIGKYTLEKTERAIKNGQSKNSFLDRRLLLTRKLLSQEFSLVKMKSSLRTCYGHYHDLISYWIRVVRKDVDVNEHERLSDKTLVKWKRYKRTNNDLQNKDIKLKIQKHEPH